MIRKRCVNVKKMLIETCVLFFGIGASFGAIRETRALFFKKEKEFEEFRERLKNIEENTKTETKESSY